MPKKSKKKKSKNNNNNNSNNSNSKKGQKMYKKIKYKLTKEEISSLLELQKKRAYGSRLLGFPRLSDTKIEIIEKIKNTVPTFKKCKLKGRFFSYKDTNKKIRSFQTRHNDNYDPACAKGLIIIATIYIFLDVDKNLKNDGALSFYETDKKTKKKWFGRKTYIEKDKFIPKTGDIIYVSAKTERKFQSILEKDKNIPTKNRFFVTMELCCDSDKLFSF